MLDDIAEKIGILRAAVPIRRRIPAHLLQAQESVLTPFAVRIFLPCFRAEVRDRNEVHPSAAARGRTPNAASCRPAVLASASCLPSPRRPASPVAIAIRRKQHCRLAIALRASSHPKQPHQLFDRRRRVVVKRPEFPLQPPFSSSLIPIDCKTQASSRRRRWRRSARSPSRSTGRPSVAAAATGRTARRTAAVLLSSYASARFGPAARRPAADSRAALGQTEGATETLRELRLDRGAHELARPLIHFRQSNVYPQQNRRLGKCIEIRFRDDSGRSCVTVPRPCANCAERARHTSKKNTAGRTFPRCNALPTARNQPPRACGRAIASTS